jgi:hypothetical protein
VAYPYDGMFYPTLPQDTQDFGQVLSGVGRSLRDISRGVSYYPYDLLGSGVDVANLALGAVGLGSERPVLGSDYLRNIARSLGMAQEPTGSATENITRLAAGLTNPMAGARAVGRVGEITTEQANRAADALVRQITGNPEATAPAVLEAAGGMVPLSRMFKPEQVKAILPETKIVDEVGNPQLMYHGTTKEFKDFKKNTTPDDHVPGISVTDEPWMASSYAKEVEGSNVRPVYVDAKNPINYEDLEAWAFYKAKEKRMKIEDEEDFAAFDIPKDKLVKWLKEDGYDAIDYRSDPMLGYGLRVFEPEQIKSAVSDPAFAGLLEPQAVTKLTQTYQQISNKVDELYKRMQQESSNSSLLNEYKNLRAQRDELGAKLPPEAQQVEQSLLEQPYKGSHTAPKADVYGATFDNLQGIMPSNVYSQEGKRLYGLGDSKVDSEWYMSALRVKGKPDSDVTIYRAVPKGVKDINDGDWVTPSKEYARLHGERTLDGDYEILSKKVKARTLSTEGYPYELGYNEIVVK